MSNSTAKGNQHEIEVKKHLETEGWSVFRVHKKALFIKGRMVLVGADAFGCDLICKKRGELPRWIQVGADGSKSKKEDQLLEHTWDTEHERVEIWLRVEGKKAYKVYVLQPVVLPSGGLGQQFVGAGLCEIRYPAAPA
jgi:hypothetical protein